MRDLDALITQSTAHGPSIGVYAARLLDVELPWTRMRTVYRLLGLARRYGGVAVDAACAKTLAIDVVDVRRIVGILEAAREHEAGDQARVVVPAAARFRPQPSRVRHRDDTRRVVVTAAAHPGGLTPPLDGDLKSLLRRLKLGKAIDTLPGRLALAKTNKLSHAEFLTLVLANEATRRDATSAQLRARAAHLDPGMRIDTFDPDNPARFDREVWTELTSLRMLEVARGALILGPVGVGKTHLATALGHLAVARRASVAFHRTDQLFRSLKAARLDATLPAEMRRLTRIDLLILDDFALQAMDATATSDFYELVVERHHKTSTIITSNREPAEWIAVMADTLLAQSAVDRLVSTSYELVVERRVLPPPATPHNPGRARMTSTPSHDDITTTTAPPPPPDQLLCPICTVGFQRVQRQRFCSDNCRKTAWSRRHHPAPQPPPVPPAQPRRDVTVYSRPYCEQRFYGQQWCHDCNQPCTRIGLGGLCPHCDQPVAHADLGVS